MVYGEEEDLVSAFGEGVHLPYAEIRRSIGHGEGDGDNDPEPTPTQAGSGTLSGGAIGSK
jgi:hypothetical protein